jgi:hypothetical protein
MIYFQAFDTGAATDETKYDDGLRSTAENPKTLLSILVQVEELPVVDCMLQIWYEQEKIAEIPTMLINSRMASSQSQPHGRNMIGEVEVGFKIPVGAVVKVASKAVGGPQAIIGAYRYEITA